MLIWTLGFTLSIGYGDTTLATSFIPRFPKIKRTSRLPMLLVGQGVISRGPDGTIKPLTISARVWLIETARTLPASAQLDGYDVSPDQYPPNEWLPKNVHLNVLNMLDPVPEELVGKYDVVHVGLIVVVVRNENPGPVLSNLMTLLSMRETFCISKILSSCLSRAWWLSSMGRIRSE